MAVGGALALQGSGRLPIAVLGDGDFLMGVTAMWTASHYELPLLIVIANNHTYNNDVAHQERVALRRERPVENKFIGQTIDGPPVDLPAMARAQGFEGAEPVTAPGALPAAMDAAVAAVAAGGRILLDVHIARG
jgi:thiamine pyrophosphate-dependent acetolactate synthase large subunit-like protein